MDSGTSAAKLLKYSLYAVIALIAGYVFIKYLWSALLPFIIAYLFAECFKPIVKYSERNRRFPKKFFVLFVVSLATVSLIFLIVGIARKVAFELGGLFTKIGSFVNLFETDDAFAAEVISKISSFLPFLNISDRLWALRDNLDSELFSMLVGIGDKFSGSLLSMLGSAVKLLPNMLIGTVVVIISTYYFAIDRVKINCFLISLFPERARSRVVNIKHDLTETVGRFLRAYGVLFLITFTELFVAFLIMGIDYAFVLAIVIALVDILPVLGTGTVLIPWGIISLVTGNLGRGIGLIITYAIITVVRQVTEPKIIGKFIGLPPLAALFSMYVGLKLIGIVGIFVFPIGAILILRIIDKRV